MSNDTHKSNSISKDSDEQLTSNSKKRWEYLASAVAGLSVLTFLGIVAAGAAGFITLAATLPQAWFGLFAMAVVASYSYVLGKEYVSYRDERKSS